MLVVFGFENSLTRAAFPGCNCAICTTNNFFGDFETSSGKFLSLINYLYCLHSNPNSKDKIYYGTMCNWRGRGSLFALHSTVSFIVSEAAELLTKSYGLTGRQIKSERSEMRKSSSDFATRSLPKRLWCLEHQNYRAAHVELANKLPLTEGNVVPQSNLVAIFLDVHSQVQATPFVSL